MSPPIQATDLLFAECDGVLYRVSGSDIPELAGSAAGSYTHQGRVVAKPLHFLAEVDGKLYHAEPGRIKSSASYARALMLVERDGKLYHAPANQVFV